MSTQVIKTYEYKLTEQGHVLKVPKVIAKVKLCGGGIAFNITDDVPFEAPTERQRKNLKKTFGIEIELMGDNYD